MSEVLWYACFWSQIILTAMSFSGKEGKTGAGGEPPRKFGQPRLSVFGSALFDIKRALQKGSFHSFAEKGRGPDPQDPPSCATDKFEKGKRERELRYERTNTTGTAHSLFLLLCKYKTSDKGRHAKAGGLGLQPPLSS